MGESLLTHVGTAENIADLLTKPIFRAKQQKLISGLLYDIYNEQEQQKVTFDL
jgi:hypothetical protein